jgi:STE24 endopeptidase
VNDAKSSRYHRSKRRADTVACLATGGLWAGSLLTGWSATASGAVGGRPSLYAAVILLAQGIALLPIAWYRGYWLERQYALSETRAASWFVSRVRIGLIALSVGAVLAELVVWSMRWPRFWWTAAALGCWVVAALLTASGPVFTLPLIQRSRPLGREALRQRLERLSARAGVPVLGLHELPLGEGSRRAGAALVGAGATRRIVLSDTLLADYSDDEIEVVLAHEIGHHVHRHLLKASLGELVLLLAGFRAAAAALDWSWRWLGLTSPTDLAGLPLVALAVGVVMVAATPLLNAWSRAHERHADRFALETASEPRAFIGAVRRMAAQNLAEERPSNAAFLLFHTHPTAEERIAAAREVLQRRVVIREKG